MSNASDELRKLAEEPNGQTQKYILRQIAAGQADVMDFMVALDERLDQADKERTKLFAGIETNQKDIERLEGRSKLFDGLNALGVILAGAIAWFTGQS